MQLKFLHHQTKGYAATLKRRQVLVTDVETQHNEKAIRDQFFEPLDAEFVKFEHIKHIIENYTSDANFGLKTSKLIVARNLLGIIVHVATKTKLIFLMRYSLPNLPLFLNWLKTITEQNLNMPTE